MILQDLSQEDLIAQIEALKVANARLSRQASSNLKLKVSDKGAVSLYGMGKWPVTLYGEQWEKLLAYVDTIREFLSDHADELSRKGE